MTSAFVTSLSPGATYLFQLQAYNSAGGGEWSPTSSALTSEQAAPDAPKPPRLLADRACDTLQLQLPAASAGCATEASFEVRYQIVGHPVWEASETHRLLPGTSARLQNLPPAAALQFALRAVNEFGLSEWSSPSPPVFAGLGDGAALLQVPSGTRVHHTYATYTSYNTPLTIQYTHPNVYTTSHDPAARSARTHRTAASHHHMTQAPLAKALSSSAVALEWRVPEGARACRWQLQWKVLVRQSPAHEAVGGGTTGSGGMGGVGVGGRAVSGGGVGGGWHEDGSGWKAAVEYGKRSGEEEAVAQVEASGMANGVAGRAVGGVVGRAVGGVAGRAVGGAAGGTVREWTEALVGSPRAQLLNLRCPHGCVFRTQLRDEGGIRTHAATAPET